MKTGNHVDPGKYIRAGKITLRCIMRGDSGTSVLLLHGLGASADIWNLNLGALSNGHRVYALDLPGFGRSERPERFSPNDFSRFVHEFMIAADIEKASFVGQSLGGGVALQFALRYPEMVSKLVLVDSAGLGKEVIWTLRAMALPVIGELLSRPSRFNVKMFFRLAVRDQSLITPAFIDLYHGLFSQPGFQGYLLRVIRSLVDLHGVREEVLAPLLNQLSLIDKPTLIVWGEKDRVLPLQHAWVGRNRIANSQIRVFKNCGHLPFFERPEEFNRIVFDFLSEPSFPVKPPAA